MQDNTVAEVQVKLDKSVAVKPAVAPVVALVELYDRQYDQFLEERMGRYGY
jgi:hypothetical protein